MPAAQREAMACARTRASEAAPAGSSEAARSKHRGALILASASPRRRELLARARVEFEVIESGVAETRLENESARDYACRMAGRKALAVSARFSARLVLGADTVVECAGEVLGKPESVAEARRMLGLLSGRAHTVTTAFALARAGRVLEGAAVESRVTFRELSGAEIEAYIESSEPFDKAGAYGIQELGARLIARLEGSRENVMGLPTREILEALGRLGVEGGGEG